MLLVLIMKMTSNVEVGNIIKSIVGTPGANATTTAPTIETRVAREGIGVNLEKMKHVIKIKKEKGLIIEV